MNAATIHPHTIAAHLVEADGEIRELRARTSDLEEATRSLRRQIIALQSHLADLDLNRELESVR